MGKTALEMLQDMDTRREEQRKKIEEDIRKWKVIQDDASKELCETDDNPDLIERYTAAENKHKIAQKKIYEEGKNLKRNKLKRSNLVSSDETRNFIRTVNKEHVEKLAPIAGRMLDIVRELFELSGEAVKIETDRNRLIQKWDEEVSAGNTGYETTFHPLPGAYELTRFHNATFSGELPTVSVQSSQRVFNSIINSLKRM